MFRALLIAAGIFASVAASAKTANIYDVLRSVNQAIVTDAEPLGLNWAVGDTAAYTLDMSFIKGSMVYTIKSITGSEAVIAQNVDLSFAGKQDCEITIDMGNGALKKMVCNGKEQQPGEAGNYEVLESKEDNVTVPAGTFNCLYIKAQDKKNNQTIEQWANPKLVPVMGMIKSILPSQMGPVTIELKSFKKM